MNERGSAREPRSWPWSAAFAKANDELMLARAKAAGEDPAAEAERLRAACLARVAAAKLRVQTIDVRETDVDAEIDSTPPDTLVPPRLGHYEIVDLLGQGGMGVVYAAFDERLGRNVAIKVLHGHKWDASGRRRERLLREAQAMARVSHPNLATVHEVGVTGDQLYVAMEFISGPTLERWLVTEDRSWHAVADVFRQIAEGLSALHEAGLVHRDIKPSNVIVGDDGWVKVLDLGLVGVDGGEFVSLEDSASDWSSSLSQVDQLLTKTGDRIGTPAYMSPEQFSGERLTPASDIFSFSVALYEALHGVHPFMAETLEELRDNVVSGRIAPPLMAGDVPARLTVLAKQGLALHPQRRPASMEDIANILGEDPTRVRRRVLRVVGGATALGLAVVAGVFAAGGLDEGERACEGSEAIISATWGLEQSLAVRDAVDSTGLSYAEPLGERIIRALDGYAGAWAKAHRQVCLDHAQGRHSEQLLDARMACLDRRRQAFAGAVELLTVADREVVDHAGEIVAELPRLDACDDLTSPSVRAYIPDTLLAAAPLDTHAHAVARDLEAQLDHAELLARAGRIDDALERSASVAEVAESMGLDESLARALLCEARVRMDVSLEREATVRLLSRARVLSTRGSFPLLAAEAVSRQMYLRGLRSGASEAVMEDAELADAWIEQAGGSPEVEALLLNNLGAVHLAAGRRAEARTALQASLELKSELLGTTHLELAPTLANLSLLTEDPDAREQLHARLVAIHHHHLGPEHPQSIDAEVFAAVLVEDPARSAELLAELCPRLEALGARVSAGECNFEKGRRDFARRADGSARLAFEAALEGLPAEDSRRELARAYLVVVGAPGDADRLGVDEDARARILAASSQAWWALNQRAELLLLDGTKSLKAGDLERAEADLEAALADLQRIRDIAQPMDHERLLALTRSALARALALRSDADVERAKALRDTATTYFMRWPNTYALALIELHDI